MLCGGVPQNFWRRFWDFQNLKSDFSNCFVRLEVVLHLLGQKLKEQPDFSDCSPYYLPTCY